MSGLFFGKQLSSFQIIIGGFLAIILVGTGFLMLPISSLAGTWTSVEDALFTATSAVCVTGLVVRDTATYWSCFGQAVILALIQIGGLGVATVTALVATVSGRKITLLQRSMLQESISAFQVGGILKLTWFICRVALLAELLGTLLMLPAFLSLYGRSGIWMALFHSVSAFCNAGFDIMGAHTGPLSSLTAFAGQAGVVLPVTLLIITGGIGFLTWDDMVKHRFRFKRYRMQSKVILTATALLVFVPAAVFFFSDFAGFGGKERVLAREGAGPRVPLSGGDAPDRRIQHGGHESPHQRGPSHDRGADASGRGPGLYGGRCEDYHRSRAPLERGGRDPA